MSLLLAAAATTALTLLSAAAYAGARGTVVVRGLLRPVVVPRCPACRSRDVALLAHDGWRCKVCGEGLEALEADATLPPGPPARMAYHHLTDAAHHLVAARGTLHAAGRAQLPGLVGLGSADTRQADVNRGACDLLRARDALGRAAAYGVGVHCAGLDLDLGDPIDRLRQEHATARWILVQLAPRPARTAIAAWTSRKRLAVAVATVDELSKRVRSARVALSHRPNLLHVLDATTARPRLAG